MLTPLRNVLIALLLGAAAVTSWYLAAPRGEPAFRPDARDTVRLGYYLEGAVFRGTNSEGRLVYQISADRIEENPDAEQLRFENVEINYFESEGVPWSARAATATAPVDRAFIDLRGSVRLVSNDTQAGRTLIETEAMRLEPDRYFATSEGPVRLAVGDNWLTAGRLEADLIDDMIRGSDVHVHIVR